jgi:hypothetical protein
MCVFTLAQAHIAHLRRKSEIVRTLAPWFSSVLRRAQESCGSSSRRTAAIRDQDSWQATQAVAHITHALRVNTAVLDLAIRARTSQATHTTRVVAAQARGAAAGIAIQDTIKVAITATYLAVVRLVVGRAEQDSTADQAHATHAPTNLVILSTPAAGEQARLDARGAASAIITNLEVPVYMTQATIMAQAMATMMSSTQLILQYSRALLAVLGV